MDEVLNDLASRLRGLTGQVVTENVPQVSSQLVASLQKPQTRVQQPRLKRGSLLVMQQSLRRHPALQLLFSTQSTALRSLYNAIHDAILAQPTTSSATASHNKIQRHGAENKIVQQDNFKDDEQGSVQFMLWKVNKYANNIELQRLQAFSSSAQYVSTIVRQARREVMQLLGFDNLPKLHQNNTASQCPWNVLFTLQASYKIDAIITQQPEAWKLHFTNSTTAMRQCLERIHNNRYDVIAWRRLLLHLSHDFPIGVVRNLWQAALILFPTSRCLVNAYVQREVQQLAKRPKLWQCQDLSEAQSVYLTHLRLLNVFYRHLRIAFSTELYMQFFQFITQYVQVDERTLDSLYRSCLRQDVGFLPTSTQLWRSYMNWRLTRIRDTYRRRQFSRQMYKRILQTPLFNLRSVKQMYDAFVVSETRTRTVLDEKAQIDKLFLRANVQATELQKYSVIFTQVFGKDNVNANYYNNSSGSNGNINNYNIISNKQNGERVNSAHTHNFKSSSLLTFLPRPLCSRTDAFAEKQTQKYDMHEVDEDELLLHELWNNLLEQTTRLHVSELSTSTLQFYARCRGLYKMRACTFLHHFNCWAQWIYYIIYQQPFLTTHERQSMMHEALILLRRFSFSEKCMSVLFTADIHLTHLGCPDRAFNLIRSQLLTQRTKLLNQLKRWQVQAVNLSRAIISLQTIVTLAVNWMRVINQVRSSMRHQQQQQQQGQHHHHHHHQHFQMLRQEQMTITVSHVAQFVIHKIDLLSLTMAVLKRALQGQQTGATNLKPTFIVRPFNVFCHKWIELVLVRERNASIAVLILKRWLEHLKLMLHSASDRRWSARECGVDQLLLNSCQQIIIADGRRCSDVFLAMDELVRVVQQLSCSHQLEYVHTSNVTFLYMYTQLQHHYFTSPKLQQLPFAIRCNELSINLPCKGCTPARFTTKCGTCNFEPDWNYLILTNAIQCQVSGLLANDNNNNNSDKHMVKGDADYFIPEYSPRQSAAEQQLLQLSAKQHSPHNFKHNNIPDENSWVVFDVNQMAGNVFNDKNCKSVTQNRIVNRPYRQNTSFRFRNYTSYHWNRYKVKNNIRSSNTIAASLPNRDYLQDGVIVECINYPTLASWIQNLATEKQSNIANVSSSISVNVLQQLVYELPTLYEYMYDFSHVHSKTTAVQQKDDASQQVLLPTAQWVVKHLQTCGAIHQ